jgi:membrane associated rhomboid family serine protease
LFLPIGDEPNPKQTPVVNYVLIGLNTLIFLFISLPLMRQLPSVTDPLFSEYIRVLSGETGVAQNILATSTSAYDLMTYRFGFKPADPSIMTIFSSMFLHAGWAHLLGNMLFLWIFGDNLEARLGPAKYLLVYLGTGVAATIFFAVFQPDSYIPLVGASGAISGVLGCYFLWFPKNQVKVFIWVLFFVRIINLPARVVLGFYLIVENFFPFILGTGSGGVAHGAHIGGFVAGLMVVMGLKHWGKDSSLNHSGPTWSSPNQGDTIRTLPDLIAGGDWDEALQAFVKMTPTQRHLLDDWDLVQLADGLTETRRFDAALAVLQRFLATRPHSDILGIVHLRAGMVQVDGLNRESAGYQHLQAVLDYNVPAEVEAKAREMIEAIDNRRRMSIH